MLTFLAFGMVATFMALIMTRRMSPLTALIVVPIVFGLLAGFTNALNGGNWSLAVVGNSLDLNFTASAIPEPSTYALGLGAAALGLAALRRRR